MSQTVIKAQSGRIVPLIDVAKFEIAPAVVFHNQVRWGVHAILHNGMPVLLFMAADFDTDATSGGTTMNKNYKMAKERMDELTIAHKYYMKSMIVIDM